MAPSSKKWPPVCKSAFTQGSDEETNEAFRHDPFYGTHKHGPKCTGDVRAVVFPLSSQARDCCTAEPKGENESSHIVSLRLCDHSTYFSIGTSLTANVTLRSLDTEEGDATWQHPIEARIYLNPDGGEAELFNASLCDTIIAVSYPEGRRFTLAPKQHCRLPATQTWSLHVQYRFGLILRPMPADVFNALLDVGQTPSLEDAHRVIDPPPRIKSIVPAAERPYTPVEDEATSDHHRQPIPASQSIDPLAPAIASSAIDERGASGPGNIPTSPNIELVAPSTANTHTSAQTETTEEDGLDIAPPSPSPSPSDEDAERRVVFEDMKTTVQEFERKGRLIVRKAIRTMTLHKAAMQWDMELAILKRISHRNIVKSIAWSAAKRTIDFEHGGQDLSKLVDRTDMFNVEGNVAEVQRRIFQQMVAAIKYLHDQNIMHRDIKPHNILLSDDHQTARLCDFGHSHIGGKWRGGGTEWYIPPEVLTQGTSDAAADIWALGITMLFVLRVIPLPGSELDAQRWEIARLGPRGSVKDRQRFREWLAIVKAAKEDVGEEWAVVRDMLEDVPARRITAEGLVKRLESGEEVGQGLLAA